MAVCFENMLKGSLSRGSILNTYFIFGNDAYLKKMYVDKIVDKVTGRDDVFNFVQFENGCNLQEVFDAKEQFPLMVDKKCVVLCDYDFEHASKSDFEKLIDLLSNPVDTTVFIFWCNNLEFELKKNEKAKKLAAAAETGGGMAVQIDHRSVSDLKKMLIDGATARGAKMDAATAGYLIENCGEDINILKSELEKLCAYVGEGTITRDIIDRVSVKSVEASVYNLAKEIFSHNVSGAMRLLDELFYMRIEPGIILHSISSSFVDVARAAAAVEQGVRVTDIAKEFGYGNRDFVLTRAAENARRLDKAKISLCLEEIVAADNALKSFNSNERAVIEQLVVKLVYVLLKGEKIDKD